MRLAGSVHRWDTWLHQLQSAFTSMPMIVSPGNHEADSSLLPFNPFGNASEDSGGECGVPYTMRLQPPISNETKGALWYSKDMGPIHFLQV